MWLANGDPLSSENRSTESGSISVPLLLLTVILGGAAVSTLGYAMLWQSKAALQLRLDRCVESAALELVGIQNTIEWGNLRMKAERAAAEAAAVPTMGSSIADVQPVLEAEVALEEAERVRWRIRQAQWIAERGCDGKSDLLLPLPNLKWSRPPPDSIGAEPLSWEGNATRLVIRLWKTNRFSQARVYRGKDTHEGNEDVFGHWRAMWIPRTSR